MRIFKLSLISWGNIILWEWCEDCSIRDNIQIISDKMDGKNFERGMKNLFNKREYSDYHDKMEGVHFERVM